MKDDGMIGYELLEQVCTLDLRITRNETSEHGDNVRVSIAMEDDPEVLQGCCFGLIFALGVLSFHGARPRGVSEIGGYREDDEWTVGDMLRHLRFERGRLQFDADYVRGRMMKTTIVVGSDGRIELETAGRGEAASRWVSQLQGKKVLSAVASSTPDPLER